VNQHHGRELSGSELALSRVDSADARSPFFLLLEAACESAIRKAMNISAISSRRLVTARESAEYLALSEREIHRMLSKRELTGVRHGRRLMLDIRDLDEWIAARKAA
jgi:excisionase family DNA binding protein